MSEEYDQMDQDANGGRLLIKKVMMENFKSYKSLDFDFFHPGVNMMLGKNGAGKSALIDGIRFVLSSEFINLRAEERRRLIHLGEKSKREVSGFVKILFDNTDRRLPLEADDVEIRRNLGLSKADYYINGKHHSGEEVMNFLETGGFSRYNPYYIVPQMRVQNLAKGSPAELLNLIKEIAGTSVYEDRKKKTLALLDETEEKMNNIEEVLKFFSTRMNELEGERSELIAYQELDRERRALEYSIYRSEFQTSKKGIEEMKRENTSGALAELHETSENIDAEIKRLEVQTERLAKQKLILEREHETALEDNKRYLTMKARLDLDYSDVQQNITSSEDNNRQFGSQLKALLRRIDSVTKEYESIEPEFNKTQKEEKDLINELDDAKRKVNLLYGKQDRQNKFGSSKERDRWIKQEVKELRTAVEDRRTRLEDEGEKLNNLRKEISSYDSSNEANLDADKKKIEKLTKKYDAIKTKRDDVANQRKQLWRNEAETEGKLNSVSAELEEMERRLSSTIGREKSQGLKALKRIKEDHNLSGIYAPVIELIEDCTEQEMLAIETCAGGSLYNVVVDTEETAAKAMELLNKEKSGRVTFMPQNRLIVDENLAIPRNETSIPIITRIKYDTTLYKKAFHHIFGSTLLCASIDEAAELSREFNLNCVTIQGDKVNRKGAYNGGFRDVRRSALKTMSMIKALREEKVELRDSLVEIRNQLSSADQLTTKYISELQNIEQKLSNAKQSYHGIVDNTRMSQKRLLVLQTTQHEKEQAINQLTIQISQLEDSIDTLQSELGTRLSGLSPGEEQDLINLNKEISEIQEQLYSKSSERADLQMRRENLSVLLTNNLLLQKEELERRISSGVFEMRPEQVEKELETVTNNLDDLAALIESLAEKKVQVSEDLDQSTERLEELMLQKNRGFKDIQNESKQMEKVMNQKSLLLQKMKQAKHKIQEIGMVPDEVNQYLGRPFKELTTVLKDIKKQLGEYTTINQKAVDQFNNLSEKEATLGGRYEKLQDSERSIREMIDQLEDKKKSAFTRTFKQVDDYLKQTFNKLTNQEGENISLTLKIPEKYKTTGLIADPEELIRQVPLEEFTGITYQVSFGEQSNKSGSLSGGQETIFAFALIFALQKCDPAPFYIFDEVDAALDIENLLAISRLIRSESDNAQFIVISHQAAVIESDLGDKYFWVQSLRRQSRIRTVTQEEALELLSFTGEAHESSHSTAGHSSSANESENSGTDHSESDPMEVEE